jgi:septal ring factor EnvC (AmiA/AmiB activator)
MTMPLEAERKIRQLDHDVQSIYEMLAEIAATQRRHGNRLAEVDTKLTEVDTKLTQTVGNMTEVNGKLSTMNGRLDTIVGLLGGAPPA